MKIHNESNTRPRRIIGQFVSTLGIAAASLCIIGFAVFAAILKHAKASGLPWHSLENIRGSIPLLLIVLCIAAAVAAGAIASDRNDDA